MHRLYRANALRNMAGTCMVLPEVLDSLHQAVAAKVQGSHALNRTNTLRSMAKTSMVLPEVFDALYQSAARKCRTCTL